MTEDPRTTSNLAVAALAFSCASVILGPFGFVPGVILGLRARREIRANPGLCGTRVANAAVWIGLLFGLLFTAAVVFGVLVLLFGGPPAQPQVFPLQ